MTKQRNYSSEKYLDTVDDFEDFGYAVQNQKRYSSRSKRTTKFKDTDEFYDDYRN